MLVTFGYDLLLIWTRDPALAAGVSSKPSQIGVAPVPPGIMNFTSAARASDSKVKFIDFAVAEHHFQGMVRIELDALGRKLPIPDEVRTR